MKKRILTLLLAVSVMAFAGCGTKNENETTTIPPVNTTNPEENTNGGNQTENSDGSENGENNGNSNEPEKGENNGNTDSDVNGNQPSSQEKFAQLKLQAENFFERLTENFTYTVKEGDEVSTFMIADNDVFISRDGKETYYITVDEVNYEIALQEDGNYHKNFTDSDVASMVKSFVDGLAGLTYSYDERENALLTTVDGETAVVVISDGAAHIVGANKEVSIYDVDCTEIEVPDENTHENFVDDTVTKAEYVCKDYDWDYGVLAKTIENWTKQNPDFYKNITSADIQLNRILYFSTDEDKHIIITALLSGNTGTRIQNFVLGPKTFYRTFTGTTTTKEFIDYLNSASMPLVIQDSSTKCDYSSLTDESCIKRQSSLRSSR